MSYSSKLTYKSILKCAKEEFLDKGFQKASMRKIAQKANVTTGAMYNYFKNKEILFDELVKKEANELIEHFKEEHDKCDKIKSYKDDNAYEEISSSTDRVLDYIYDNFEIIKLIVCCSQGTKYENFVEELIDIEELATRKTLTKSGFEIKPKDDFFIHVMASSGMYNTFEAVKHDLSKEDAMYYMNKIKHFYYAGWNEILDL